MILSKNLALLTFLYFIQGLPYGFQAKFLPILLRSEGISLTSVGLFKFLLAPWLCKALWAPLIDRYKTKRIWLLYSVFGLVITCLFAILISPKQLVLLSIVLFSLNFWAATQDIAVDGIAVNLLERDELGQGNTVQVVGYKVGSIFGGGVLVLFLDSLGWAGLFAFLALLYFEAWMFAYVSPLLQTLDREELENRAKKFDGIAPDDQMGVYENGRGEDMDKDRSGSYTHEQRNGTEVESARGKHRSLLWSIFENGNHIFFRIRLDSFTLFLYPPKTIIYPLTF